MASPKLRPSRVEGCPISLRKPSRKIRRPHSERNRMRVEGGGFPRHGHFGSANELEVETR